MAQKKQLGPALSLFITILGALIGFILVFVPFLLDTIHHRSLIVSVVGYIYFFVVIALLLSAIIHFIGILSSKRIRNLFVKNPIKYTIWIAIGFGIIIGILILMFFGPAKNKGASKLIQQHYSVVKGSSDLQNEFNFQ